MPQARQPCFFQGGIVIIVEVVDSHNGVAAREQLVGKCRADKSGNAGDEDSFHDGILWNTLV